MGLGSLEFAGAADHISCLAMEARIVAVVMVCGRGIGGGGGKGSGAGGKEEGSHSRSERSCFCDPKPLISGCWINVSKSGQSRISHITCMSQATAIVII